VFQSENDDEFRRRILLDRLKRLKRLLKECSRLMELILLELEHDKDIPFEELHDRKSLLIDQGLVSEDDILEALSLETGLERIDISRIPITPELLASIPSEIAKRDGCFPVALKEDTVYLAVSDPLNTETARELERLLNKKIVYMLAPEEEILRFVRAHYGDP
jgi:type IV pilus assembly protein PilB